ncbi:hypothetical protein B0H13DRAFT_1924983 [Mycena leptocephala]|nr:hypothetical protein B0H13DRAFT_1924983 [Mycena leptocephala]
MKRTGSKANGVTIRSRSPNSLPMDRVPPRYHRLRKAADWQKYNSYPNPIQGRRMRRAERSAVQGDAVEVGPFGLVVFSELDEGGETPALLAKHEYLDVRTGIRFTQGRAQNAPEDKNKRLRSCRESDGPRTCYANWNGIGHGRLEAPELISNQQTITVGKHCIGSSESKKKLREAAPKMGRIEGRRGAVSGGEAATMWRIGSASDNDVGASAERGLDSSLRAPLIVGAMEAFSSSRQTIGGEKHRRGIVTETALNFEPEPELNRGPAERTQIHVGVGHGGETKQEDNCGRMFQQNGS